MSDKVDWNAIAAQVLADYNTTGQWYMGDPIMPAAPDPPQALNPVAAPPSNGDPFPLVAPTPGYTVVLRDDFSNGYNMAEWGHPFPYLFATGPSANGAYNWNPGDVNVVSVPDSWPSV